MEEQGNAALFDTAYQTYGPALFRFCLMQMKNPADAEDVLQEVFIKLLYRAPAFRSPEHMRRWLFQVALNQCRDEWKRSRRKDVPLETVLPLALPTAEQELLREVLSLPEKQRTVIHLYYYENCSVQEIAKLLGVTVSAVKMRLKRGRDALKNRLEESP